MTTGMKWTFQPDRVQSLMEATNQRVLLFALSSDVPNSAQTPALLPERPAARHTISVDRHSPHLKADLHGENPTCLVLAGCRRMVWEHGTNAEGIRATTRRWFVEETTASSIQADVLGETAQNTARAERDISSSNPGQQNLPLVSLNPSSNIPPPTDHGTVAVLDALHRLVLLLDEPRLIPQPANWGGANPGHTSDRRQQCCKSSVQHFST